MSQRQVRRGSAGEPVVPRAGHGTENSDRGLHHTLVLFRLESSFLALWAFGLFPAFSGACIVELAGSSENTNLCLISGANDRSARRSIVARGWRGAEKLLCFATASLA